MLIHSPQKGLCKCHSCEKIIENKSLACSDCGNLNHSECTNDITTANGIICNKCFSAKKGDDLAVKTNFVNTRTRVRPNTVAIDTAISDSTALFAKDCSNFSFDMSDVNGFTISDRNMDGLNNNTKTEILPPMQSMIGKLATKIEEMDTRISQLTAISKRQEVEISVLQTGVRQSQENVSISIAPTRIENANADGSGINELKDGIDFIKNDNIALWSKFSESCVKYDSELSSMQITYDQKLNALRLQLHTSHDDSISEIYSSIFSLSAKSHVFEDHLLNAEKIITQMQTDVSTTSIYIDTLTTSYNELWSKLSDLKENRTSVSALSSPHQFLPSTNEQGHIETQAVTTDRSSICSQCVKRFEGSTNVKLRRDDIFFCSISCFEHFEEINPAFFTTTPLTIHRITKDIKPAAVIDAITQACPSFDGKYVRYGTGFNVYSVSFCLPFLDASSICKVVWPSSDIFYTMDRFSYTVSKLPNDKVNGIAARQPVSQNKTTAMKAKSAVKSAPMKAQPVTDEPGTTFQLRIDLNNCALSSKFIMDTITRKYEVLGQIKSSKYFVTNKLLCATIIFEKQISNKLITDVYRPAEWNIALDSNSFHFRPKKNHFRSSNGRNRQ